MLRPLSSTSTSNSLKSSGTKGITTVAKYISEPPKLAFCSHIINAQDKEEYNQPTDSLSIRIPATLHLVKSFIKGADLDFSKYE